MQLQDIFYLVGIIYMSFSALFLLAIIILLAYLVRKIIHFYEALNYIIQHPGETAIKVGSKIAEKAINKVTKMKR